MCAREDKADQAFSSSGKSAAKGLKASIALVVMFMMITSVAVATPENEVRGGERQGRQVGEV